MYLHTYPWRLPEDMEFQIRHIEFFCFYDFNNNSHFRWTIAMPVEQKFLPFVQIWFAKNQIDFMR